VGYAGWIEIANFFSGEFFLHALWAIVIALLPMLRVHLQAVLRLTAVLPD
jgi:hypothetical protein